jgi:hypothetical protein
VELFKLSLLIQINSPEEECQVRLAALLKEMAIGRVNGLPALSFDEALSEDAMQTPRPKIQEAVLKPFRVARAAARELLLGVETGSTVAALLEQRKQIYTAMDTTFVVEVATAKALAGIAGQRLLERLALGVMPSEGAGEVAPTVRLGADDVGRQKNLQHDIAERPGQRHGPQRGD